MSYSVLSLCDRTGNMIEPWVEAGYESWIVDTWHKRGVHRDGKLIRVGGDIREWEPPKKQWVAIFAFPPCTDLSYAGVAWFKDKGLGRVIEALQLVERCRAIAESTGAPWMLENPVSTVNVYWRKPDHTFESYEYAGWLSTPEEEAYTKKTCLWTGNGFIMPERKPVTPLVNRWHNSLPWTSERTDLREATPRGFARAVFATNQPPPTSQGRMQRGAYITHRKRTDKTEQLIRQKIRNYRVIRKKPTKATIARALGMSREHLSRRYGYLFGPEET